MVKQVLKKRLIIEPQSDTQMWIPSPDSRGDLALSAATSEGVVGELNRPKSSITNLGIGTSKNGEWVWKKSRNFK